MMITESSKYAVLPMTCSALISYLDNADYVITRFKSEHVIVNSYQRWSSSDEENAALSRKYTRVSILVGAQ